MSLDIQNLRVMYGKVRALDGVSVKLEPGEMFFLLGPSGCGKSTLLRSVAGFIEEFEGEIRIGGEIKTRIAESLKLVGLSGYEERRSGELSGGQ
ncbi:MAG: ATP-binding cassette domain-containing protein [Planctomycetes bacterium]|nr:ATP-binding cassette domain-containing protein [Planctomycetota bacterium]